jgi:hypothetical protein
LVPLVEEPWESEDDEKERKEEDEMMRLGHQADAMAACKERMPKGGYWVESDDEERKIEETRKRFAYQVGGNLSSKASQVNKDGAHGAKKNYSLRNLSQEGQESSPQTRQHAGSQIKKRERGSIRIPLTPVTLEEELGLAAVRHKETQGMAGSSQEGPQVSAEEQHNSEDRARKKVRIPSTPGTLQDKRLDDTMKAMKAKAIKARKKAQSASMSRTEGGTAGEASPPFTQEEVEDDEDMMAMLPNNLYWKSEARHRIPFTDCRPSVESPRQDEPTGHSAVVSPLPSTGEGYGTIQ